MNLIHPHILHRTTLKYIVSGNAVLKLFPFHVITRTLLQKILHEKQELTEKMVNYK